jgi:prepilin-type N-terminal cleavage/methylation domain-containing protein
MKTPSRRHPAAFTLIELMAVVTIIVILAGIVVGGMGYVNEKQARDKARVQIALLSKAIEEYKLDMGSYPGVTAAFGGTAATGAAGDYSQVLYTALFYEGYQYTNPATPPANWTKATKIYLPELDPRNNKQGWVDSTTASTPSTNLKLRDPWGNNYRYRVAGDDPTKSNAQNPDFDLWSMGKDGQTDTANPAMSQAKNRDDVRNF